MSATESLAQFTHLLLLAPTPASWVAQACSFPDLLLVDHANCEKKAASTALSLMFAYSEDLDLAMRMSRLAREELRHYEQVVKMIRFLNIKPERLAPGRYAAQLRRLVSNSEPQREVDLMICGALIEARSCERFALLARNIGAPLSGLFKGLHEAEARHHETYLRLARRAAARSDLNLVQRITLFAALEARLITSPDLVFRFHSGAPQTEG